MRHREPGDLCLLLPAVFTPFFHYVADANDAQIYPLQLPPFRFDRVLGNLERLDLNAVMIRTDAKGFRRRLALACAKSYPRTSLRHMSRKRPMPGKVA